MSPARIRLRIDHLYGIAVILLFSGFTLISRHGIAASLAPADIAALRFSIAGLLLTPVLLHHGWPNIRWRDGAALAFLGGLGFALLAYTGFSLAPAAHGAVLLHGTLPLFSCLLAWRLRRNRPPLPHLLGLAAICLGVLAMAWDSLATNTLRQLQGDAALLLAALSWSAYGLLAQRLGLRPAHAAAIVAVLSMCSYLPIYAALPNSGLSTTRWQTLLVQGLFQGVLIGVASLYVYTQAVMRLGTVKTALFTAAVPCVTTIAAVFLLGEVPAGIALSGVAMVTLGMAVALGTPRCSTSPGKPWR